MSSEEYMESSKRSRVVNIALVSVLGLLAFGLFIAVIVAAALPVKTPYGTSVYYKGTYTNQDLPNYKNVTYELKILYSTSNVQQWLTSAQVQTIVNAVAATGQEGIPSAKNISERVREQNKYVDATSVLYKVDGSNAGSTVYTKGHSILPIEG